MHNCYEDILLKLGSPRWWDQNAVPRYCDFSPDEIPNIYATEVIYFLIQCQNCGEPFRVQMSTSGYSNVSGEYKMFTYMNDNLKYLHYGDPPNNKCCGMGSSMNCDDIEIMEFWVKNRDTDYLWERKHEYEIRLDNYENYEVDNG